MPNIWLDVTTTLNWHRPPVGIVRVEAEVFKYFASLSRPDVRFCVFDLPRLSYREVRADDVRAVIERFHRSAASAPDVAAVPTSVAKRATEQARKLIEGFPPAVRSSLTGAARKSEPVLRRALHEYRKASKTAGHAADKLTRLGKKMRAAPPPVSQGEPPPFGPGDVVVSLGLDWDQKDRVQLYHLKLALGLKVVLFCYDLIPVLFPHLCVSEVAGIFARYFVDVAWCADEVMCISKSSQRDFLALMKETGAPEPRTSIVHLGSNLPNSEGSKPGKIDDLVKGRFLLFVSTIERRKNHEVIYRAITQLVNEGRTDLPQIVFVGMMGWGVNDFLSDLRIDPRARGRFTLLNHVTDEQLALLYEHAEFTLYPSLYEGWGLPLAEGLAHGKFCIASNTSSLPEVGGALVEYVDPWECRRWAERIAFYLDHPEVLAQREKAIRDNYVAPTWSDTGRAVFDAARRLST